MISMYTWGEVPPARIFARVEMQRDVSTAVAKIIASVRAEGDEALRRYAREFDRAELSALEVSSQEIAAPQPPYRRSFWSCWKRLQSTSGISTAARSGRVF